MIVDDILSRYRDTLLLSLLDLRFARLLGRLAGDSSEGLLLAAALTSQATRQGHICLSLERAVEQIDDAAGSDRQPWHGEPQRWSTELAGSPVVGVPGEYRPLILDSRQRLYLYRYWAYEEALGRDLIVRAGTTYHHDKTRVHNCLGRLFSGEPGEVDDQKVAAATALHRGLCVVSGGPGTGKTFTVVRMLALMQELAQPRRLRVGLAAPTGKAAGRLEQAVSRAKEQLPMEAAVLAGVPDQAVTLHRLLGARRGTVALRHNRDNPLPLDVLVVDEVSMVDLALLAKLVAALLPETRLVLLGDKDQLASVQAGAVLGDLCGPGPRNRFSVGQVDWLAQVGVVTAATAVSHDPAAAINPLADSIVLLEKSYRFLSASGIGRLARAVNRGDSRAVLACLTDAAATDLTWTSWQNKDSRAILARTVLDNYRPYLAANSAEEAHGLFQSFRLLCGLRQGEFGVEPTNLWIENLLVQQGLVQRDSLWYPGRPVMIRRNDYTLKLYNGDIGITMLDKEGRLRVCFITPGGEPCFISPARMPEHELTYAMTVHQSQGSEFDRVALLLPDRPAAVISRELLYTAITRARHGFTLWANEPEVCAAVEQRIDRFSGLEQRLWPGVVDRSSGVE